MTRIWARKGTRPQVVRQQQFEYVYIFGAVCPKKDSSVGLILPRTGIICMEKHLEAISENVERGKHAVVILDRASWHTSKNLNIPSNISLLSLPPASPELNPVEPVWRVLRDRYLSNRCFDDYEDIVDCCCKAWNKFTEEPTAIYNLCSRDWIF